MSEDKIKKSLRYSVYDGTAFSVMDGMTSSFITPFAVALNSSVNLIAALTYVPQLIGAIVQLFASKILEIAKDRKRVLVIGSLLHALLWIPLLLIPYATPSQKYLLVVYISLQNFVWMPMNPIGNSLLGDLVPKYERGRFFGIRNRIAGATSFIAALLAGLVLNYYSTKNPFTGFTILFSIAFAARITSSLFKSMLYNPPADMSHEEKFSITDFVRRMDKTNYGHFVIYTAFFKFVTNIAAPFFAVYMLKDLHFSYLQFTALVASELVASFIAMGIWGKYIDETGTKSVLYITGILTPFIPLLWVISGNFYYLIIVEVLSGVSWSGFNLASSNFIFDAVKPENRVRCIAYFKFFEGMAIFLGAGLGGVLVDKLPAWIFISSIPIVFLISGIGRLAVSIIFLPALKEARLIELGLGHTFFKRYITIRPSEGFVYEVIGKYHSHDGQKEQKESSKPEKQKINPKKGNEFYNKKLMKYIDKNISPKKEKHDITDMHEIEHLTEEIEKGKARR